jgi:predicted RNA polymerase sigma factor
MADDRRLSGGTVRAHEALDRALRDEPGRVLSVLVRSLGDIDLAEDALQDAAAAALDRWPVDGVPANPLGQQDRTLWDGAAITEANRLLAGAAAAARDDPPGPYQLQAAIASVHANAARPEDTRWHDIARL